VRKQQAEKAHGIYGSTSFPPEASFTHTGTSEKALGRSRDQEDSVTGPEVFKMNISAQTAQCALLWPK
jgi:hypothetical protein